MAADFPPNIRGAVDLSGIKARAEARASSPQSSTGGSSAPNYVVEGTDANFTEIIQLSQQVAVVVDLWAAWSEPSSVLSPVLETVVNEFAGRLVLVRVDVDANPQLAQAFQAQSIPTVVAILGGRPAALFTGALPEAQVREALSSVLDAAAQMGVTGAVDSLPRSAADAPPTDGGDEAPSEPPLSPVQQAAFDALEADDLDAAAAIYEKAVVENPKDDESAAGLANVRLLQRLRDTPPGLTGIEAVFAQADQLFSSQLVEPALTTLLDAWLPAADDERQRIRERLLEYFTSLGNDSPFVAPARARLASLLY